MPDEIETISDVQEPNPSTESSTEGGNNDVPNPASSAEDQPKSMLEVAQKIYEDSVDETPKAEGEESDVLPKDTTAPEGETESEEEAEEVDDSAPSDPDAKLPFAKHERFQELLGKAKERDAFESQAKEYGEKAKAWDQHQGFIEQHGIDQQDVNKVMTALALSKTDPDRARQLLEPLMQSLQEVNPNVLPADLKKQVDDGEISEAMAKRLWAAECKNKSGMRSGETLAKQQQQALASSLSNAVTTWENNVRKLNPGFVPSKDGSMGLFEITTRNFQFHVANALEKYAPSPELYIRCLDQALKEAQAVFKKASPAKPTRPNPKAKASVPGNKDKKYNPDLEIAATARKHGYNFSRNGEESE